MNKGTEELIASIKPDLKLAQDKSLPHSVSFPAIDRLSDVLTLDALSELIAALEQAKTEAKEFRHRLRNEQALLDSADKRIDELENDEVRQRLANAEHQLYMAELAKHNLKASRRAQFKKRRAAERRFVELSESHKKLREGMAAIYNAICADGASTSLSAILTFVKQAFEESAAAGGTVEGSD